jgi:hypothetical protein
MSLGAVRAGMVRLICHQCGSSSSPSGLAISGRLVLQVLLPTTVGPQIADLDGPVAVGLMQPPTYSAPASRSGGLAASLGEKPLRDFGRHL